MADDRTRELDAGLCARFTNYALAPPPSEPESDSLRVRRFLGIAVLSRSFFSFSVIVLFVSSFLFFLFSSLLSSSLFPPFSFLPYSLSSFIFFFFLCFSALDFMSRFFFFVSFLFISSMLSVLFVGTRG